VGKTFYLKENEKLKTESGAKNNSQLPKGWEVKKLGEVCEILDNLRKPITKRDRIDGDYPYYGATGILSYIDDYIFDEQLVLIGEDGAKWFCGANSSFIVNGKFWVNNHAHVVRPNKNIIFDNWIVYFLNFSDLTEYITGMTVPKLNQGNLKNIQITVPPLSEQKRIVAILDRTFKAIDQAKTNAEQNLKNAKELFESYLNRIFEEKGDDWEVKKLGEIGKVSMCKRILKKQTTQIGEIPFYKIGTFGKKPNAYISKKIYDDYKSKYSFPKKGDILLSASGTIGRCVIYNGKPAYFQDSNIVWIGNNEKEVTNEYLYNFYGFCDWNPSKGATISRLYNDDLRRIIIPFPKSKEEQKQIVAQLDKLQTETKKLEIIYQQKINNLVELKKSILQKAFKGEL
jgi:type I restriction enzyme S subunit